MVLQDEKGKDEAGQLSGKGGFAKNRRPPIN